MAPCTRYTFEECVQVHGLEDDSSTADLLCGIKGVEAFELISAAHVANLVYLITNIYIHVAEFSVLLQKSNIWGTGAAHEKEGTKSIARATLTHVALGSIVYVATEVAIQILSDPLDNRSNSIVVGLSQLFAGVVFFMMSVSVPQWFGIYHSNKHQMMSYTSGREIRFNVAWIIWKDLVSMFFFNMYFSCADFGLSVLWGTLIGIAIGILSVLLAMKARSPSGAKSKKILAIVAIVFYALASWYVAWNGMWYILMIWRPDDDYAVIQTFFLSLAWIGIMITFHVAMYFWTKRKKRMGYSMRFTSQIFSQGRLGKMVESVLREDSAAADCDESSGLKEVTANSPSEEKDVGDGTTEDKKSKPRVKIAEDSRYVSPDDAPSCMDLFLSKLVETFPGCCGPCLKKYAIGSSNARGRLDYVRKVREKTWMAKFFIALKRFLWYVLSFAFLFFTIVNIAASYEQCAARTALGPAWDILFPPDYNIGQMCAWDAAGPNATIQSFETLDDVDAANFTVIHCGKCGACSNWNDLTLQYTTREVLAGITKVCAIKSLGRKVNFSDPEDPVVKCNRLQVGFTDPCAEAWAWDEVHTKNRAVFTFIQARLSNAFSDMAVTYQDITSATIDEALSGPRFIPWVGATRRRMNIKSDIQRPANQQCTVAQENWEEIFTEPFKPPVGGTYNVQKPGQPSSKVVIKGQESFE